MSAVGRSGEMSWPDKTPSDSLASRHNRWKTGNEGEGEVKGDESRWRGVAMKQGGSWLRCDVNIDRMSAISDTVYRQYYFLCSHFVIEVRRYICSNDVTPLPMQNYNIPQKALITSNPGFYTYLHNIHISIVYSAHRWQLVLSTPNSC